MLLEIGQQIRRERKKRKLIRILEILDLELRVRIAGK
jgi:hypothetical protein